MKSKYFILLIFISITLIFSLYSCETYRHSYSERKGLMLLKTTEFPNNRKFNSRSEITKKKRTYRKLHKR